jgi:hypothetical protein
MSDGIAIGPNIIQFEDDFIAVRIPSFTPTTGQVQVLFEKKSARVGFYYVTVSFLSGDSSRMDYDGENPNNPEIWEINSSHRHDTIVKLEATKVR